MYLLSFQSFWEGLFTVDGIRGGTTLAFLPYLITALSLGVLLASIYFTVWRLIEAKIVKRLYEKEATSAQDALTLAELGFSDSWKLRLLRFVMRSHSCMLYKNISCDELDEQKLALMREAGEVSDPDSSSPATEADDKESTQDTPPRRKRKLRPRTRMKIAPDTRFYILPSQISYVEEHPLKVNEDDFMGLVFTVLGTLVLWFGLLCLVDPVVGFLLK